MTPASSYVLRSPAVSVRNSSLESRRPRSYLRCNLASITLLPTRIRRRRIILLPTVPSTATIAPLLAIASLMLLVLLPARIRLILLVVLMRIMRRLRVRLAGVTSRLLPVLTLQRTLVALRSSIATLRPERLLVLRMRAHRWRRWVRLLPAVTSLILTAVRAM